MQHYSYITLRKWEVKEVKSRFYQQKFFWRNFGKSNFLPKILNVCRIGLPLAKTYWMIVICEPTKEGQKIPTICTCQTLLHILSKLAKNEYWGHFQNSLQVRKNHGSHHRLSGNAYPRPMGESLCHLVRIDVKNHHTLRTTTRSHGVFLFNNTFFISSSFNLWFWLVFIYHGPSLCNNNTLKYTKL